MERQTKFLERVYNWLEDNWDRLKKRDKWPRCWWFPPQSQVEQKEYDDGIQKQYEECVFTVRRTMLALLVFSLFCIVTAFGTPDSALIATEAKIDLPFANVKIAFAGFLVAAPFLLIVLTIYLHVFNTSRLLLEAKYSVRQVPTLFTIKRPLPDALTAFIFYWLVPLVLLAISWKAFPRPLPWGLPLLGLTILVTAALVLNKIRVCPEENRYLINLLRWIVLVLLAFVAGFATWDIAMRDAEAFRRPLDLFRADLNNKYLVGENLEDANLKRANLRRADLQFAWLINASMERADLREADLQWAILNWAELQGANLQGAKLQNAIMRGVNLKGADLEGAILEEARDLSCNQLQKAKNWNLASRDQKLSCDPPLQTPE